MKNPARVAELLAELREHADNDFERHRIDVLERDLTAPPVVEVIDETHQRFDGFNYGTLPSLRGYFQGVRPLHRVVWTYYYGEIPDGCDIHHRDRNPSNNDISNLQLLTKAEHQEIHRYSKRGVKHRRETFICINCGKEYEANLAGGWGNKYCSPQCQRQHQTVLAGGRPYIDRKTTSTCQYCGKTFEHYQSQRGKYCSLECSHAATRGVKKTRHAPRKCAWCGKEFPYSRHADCCSLSCAGFLREAKKRAKKEENQQKLFP